MAVAKFRGGFEGQDLYTIAPWPPDMAGGKHFAYTIFRRTIYDKGSVFVPIDGLVTVLTTLFSVAVKVVGLPDQIKSNHARKSTNGLSGWFVASAFISYMLWTIHGLIRHDWSLIIGQGLGVITTGIIVVQIFLYRDQSVKKETKLSAGVWLLLPNLVAYTKRKVRASVLRKTSEA